jgi:small subunit ribosomal protein S6
VFNPNTTEEDLKKITDQVEHIVTEKGGEVSKLQNEGRRKLAYPIEKFDDGIYTYIFINGSGQEIAEVERRLRVNDAVIRYLTVRTDEDLKRAAKVKAKRKGNAALPRKRDDDFSDLGLSPAEQAALEEM